LLFVFVQAHVKTMTDYLAPYRMNREELAAKLADGTIKLPEKYLQE